MPVRTMVRPPVYATLAKAAFLRIFWLILVLTNVRESL